MGRGRRGKENDQPRFESFATRWLRPTLKKAGQPIWTQIQPDSYRHGDTLLHLGHFLRALSREKTRVSLGARQISRGTRATDLVELNSLTSRAIAVTPAGLKDELNTEATFSYGRVKVSRDRGRNCRLTFA